MIINNVLLCRCAGLCSYEGHGGLCSIRLSEPLLKFRPRKDLVETLLVSVLFIFVVYCGCVFYTVSTRNGYTQLFVINVVRQTVIYL